MPTRIETLAELANQMEQPLSTGSFTYFSDGTTHLASQLHVDHEQIGDYMEDHGIPKPSLHHTLLSIHPNRAIPGADSDAQACLFNEPHVLHGQVYYPHIAISFTAEKPNMSSINNSLRHELWHLVQDSVELAYNKRHIVNTVRNLGLAALGGATALAGFGEHTPAGYVMVAATAAAGAITAAAPGSLLQFFSRQEMEAKNFAREHQDFQPISLLA